MCARHAVLSECCHRISVGPSIYIVCEGELRGATPGGKLLPGNHVTG
jgi:hypothetical protein